MTVDVLLGLQWGDEGKGKIVDYLASKYDVVARFQGGPNAGHTLEFDGIKHVLHQIPSGIFHSHITNVIGNGVILSPVIFKEEGEKLLQYNIDITKNLLVSKKAQLILPSHQLLDEAYELAKGDKKIGSTKKGIGPTYQDKIARQGLRVGDILSPSFKEKYDSLVANHKSILDFHNYDYSALAEKEAAFLEAIEFFKKFQLIDSENYINDALKSGKSVVAEGAQGSLLDIDFGTYPFVTSSTTTAAGACTGLGVAPSKVGKVFGIFKAYCTRVGSGPFPTELFDKDGDDLCQVGREFGSTTGRKRRCGWLDIPALNYAITLNGVTELMMMKTDVLDGFDTIKVCTAYKMKDGSTVTTLPYDLEDIEAPIYQEFKGWKQDLTKQESFDTFPTALNEYIDFVEKATGTPISVVSVGPDRKETVYKELALS